MTMPKKDPTIHIKLDLPPILQAMAGTPVGTRHIMAFALIAKNLQPSFLDAFRKNPDGMHGLDIAATGFLIRHCIGVGFLDGDLLRSAIMQFNQKVEDALRSIVAKTDIPVDIQEDTINLVIREHRSVCIGLLDNLYLNTTDSTFGENLLLTWNPVAAAISAAKAAHPERAAQIAAIGPLLLDL